MDIAPIKTQHDYRRVLKEIEGLMTAKRNTPEGGGIRYWIEDSLYLADR
jgi:antitoxin component HigA of HigAB toxin-antitoxin module